MKRILSILLFIILIVKLCIGQTSFEFGINTEDNCIVSKAAKDNAGNIVIVGIIGSITEHDYDAFILKVRPDGSYDSERFNRKDTISYFSTIDVLSNGEYFITGSYSIEGNYNERDRLWVVLLDSEFNLISEKTFLVRQDYIGFTAMACTIIDNEENIVLATGVIEEETKEKTNFIDFAFYKFDQQGDTLLSKYYHYIYDQLPWELRQMPGSDNMMLIEQTTNIGGNNELLFLDPEFNILKVNYISNDIGINGDLSSDYWVTDTSFLMSGFNSWYMESYHEYYLATYLVDTSAVIHQELVMNRNDTTDYTAWRKSMAYANDSTIYIGGFQIYMGFWITDPTIVELYVIDKNMNLLGYKELGGDANYELWGIIATDDDGCLLYGTRYDNPDVHQRDVHIWKVLRKDIDITTRITEITEASSKVKMYPNPVMDELNIHLPFDNSQTNVVVSISTLEGKTIFHKKITEQGNMVSLDVRNLQNGLYVLNVIDNQTLLYSEKIIKN